MDNLPEKTGEIFERLTSNKPGFICDNSTDREIQKLYNIVEEHFEGLYELDFSKKSFA